MIQTLYNGASGLTGQQKNIDVIANNVANVNNDGFKKERFDFQDALYMRMRAPHPASNGPEKNLMRGSGTIEYQTASVLIQGALRETDRVLDFALDGPGFFAVEPPFENEDYEGEADISIHLIRNGNFHLSVEEEGTFLVDSHGRYLLSEDGERIVLPPEMPPEELVCDSEGYLYYFDAEGNQIDLVRLQIVDFVNPGGLEDIGNGAYIQTENSGEMVESGAAVLQRRLEASNVDYSEEVTRLIRAQRAFQMASRVVTTADQMMGIANSIRQ
ncbi:MAG: flagellar hook-basal body protein [Oscillospiraceae bacterium]|jgi:flagellar basal-body rod protein FlgG|nr:flagellar hook-basal body protein [Oscillospiraceae bacterium]